MTLIRLIILSTFYFVSQISLLGQASPILKHQRLDFERFKTAFYQLEAKPFLHISSQEVESNFNKLQDALRKPLTPLEQFKCYSVFLSALQCGHTSMLPNGAVFKEWSSKKQCLPFDVVMINKRLFIAPVHKNDIPKKAKNTPAEKQKPKKKKEELNSGTEIVSIDKKSIQSWVTAISPYISSDENGEDFKYYKSGQLFDFYRYLAIPSNKDSVEIRYMYKKDTLTQYVKLGYPLFHTLKERLDPEKKRKKTENFGTFSIEKNKYGYFRFETFKDSEGKKYDEFLKKSFETMQRQKISQLIIDVRGNTGGYIQGELLRYLIPGQTEIGKYRFEKQAKRRTMRKLGVKMFEESTRTYLKNIRKHKKIIKKSPNYDGSMSVQPNRAARFKGKIIVITDEGTFSAAAMLACHLKTLSDAIIIGQTSGGTFYAGNAGTLPLKLKKSGFEIMLNPNAFSSQIQDSEDPDPNIKVPDVITFSSAWIPDAKSYRPKVKISDDPIFKVAEKQFK